MTAGGLSPGGLDGRTIDRYLAGRPPAGYREYRSPKALRPLLEYLAVLPVVQDPPAGPVEALLGRFGNYLLGERGLTTGTVRGYCDCVRPFVAGRLRDGVLELSALGHPRHADRAAGRDRDASG